MWLRECYELYPELTKLRTEQEYDLPRVEREVHQASSGYRVDAKVLLIIENSAGWSYPSWWPRLSEKIKDPIKLEDLHSPEGKQEAVKLLHTRLRHIEVVSVVLRFLCPEEFGILSPPVMAFVNLPPANTHADLYFSYLFVLKKLLRKNPALKHVANVDMALWSAAHLNYFLPKDRARRDVLSREIWCDEFFQEIRLNNLFDGFGRYWQGTDRERLVLSRSLLAHDSTIAGVIAAKCFEDAVVRLGKKLHLNPRNRKPGQTKPSALVDEMVGQPNFWNLPLTKWRDLRDNAVHEDLSEKEIEELIGAAEQLYSRL